MRLQREYIIKTFFHHVLYYLFYKEMNDYLVRP